MANGILGSSKGALIFAGSVIACSVLIAGSMGSQFTPKSQEDYAQNRAVAAPSDTNAKGQNTPVNPVAQPSDNSVFGSFEGFADDTQLIDNTNGFDPTPPSDADIIIPQDQHGQNTPEGGTNGGAVLRLQEPSGQGANDAPAKISAPANTPPADIAVIEDAKPIF